MNLQNQRKALSVKQAKHDVSFSIDILNAQCSTTETMEQCTIVGLDCFNRELRSVKVYTHII